MNTLIDNPLLSTAEFPRYDAIRPEHVTPAMTALLAQADAALEKVVGDDVPVDYDAIAAVLDVSVERLRTAWSQVGFLQSVADTPDMRAAHAENQPRVIDFYTRLSADPRLFAKYKALATSPAAATLDTARKKALDDALRDFVLGGAELEGAARERFAAIQERLGALSQGFGDHVLDATDAFELLVEEADLDGVPADVCAAARSAAEAAGKPGFKLTLQAPCYVPVIQYANNRALREQMFRAYSTRASEFGQPEHDNSAVLAEILALRQEEAALLGHASYAHVSLVPKMARSPEEVLAFIRDLARRARPFAETELAELRSYAARELGLPALEAWDRHFVSEKLKQARFAFSNIEVKQYFTEPTVLSGLLRLIETLFGVDIRPADAPLWHASARFFSVFKRGDSTLPVAGFYLDLQARSGKGSGAWMDDARQRWQRPEGRLQTPLAHLVCNFAAPIGGKPARLTHDDVITLFHEFGHGLHHMLTQVDELAVSGIAGVEWDAVELPSQFMENFCWDWQVLQKLTAHADTGEPLPRALFDRMMAARNFGNGLQMLRHCEMALFDMQVHLLPDGSQRVLATAQEAAAEVGVVAPPPFLRYPHAFTHLFDGGYAAGYYSYAWAEVLSADAFSAFEEAGVFDPATGERYRQQILEVGGSRPAMESFKAFRGREPRLDALLRHQGLVVEPA